MKCPISRQCGSCRYIEESNEKQLSIKYNEMKALFKDYTVHKVNGMEHPYGYRNKVIVAFDQQYRYGLYEESTHRIVPMQQCLLHDEKTHRILLKIQQLFKKYHVSIYDSKRNRGLIRHVLIRRAVQTDQSLVTLVASEGIFKGSKNFCKELIKACPDVKTIVLNVNKRQTSIVLSQEEKVLYGKGFIVDELCGLTFKISSQSFYQINHEQCIKLYTKAIELLNPQKDDLVLDTYAGIGTIGMIMANNVRHVLSVELNHQAHLDARVNAKMNHLQNIEFIEKDATEYMVNYHGECIDAIMMDPPRSGSTLEFIQSATKLKPRSIVYISCNPYTQVKDLEIFKKYGYVTQDIYLYDMFPFTEHVECMALLQRRKCQNPPF